MLNKKRANQIVTELREQHKTDNDEILEYLKTSDATTSKDMLKIIDAMLQNEPFFNFFIGNNFINYAEANNKFFDLIVNLSRTERFGYDVSNLSKLYEINPGITIFLLEKLQKIDEYKIALTVDYILGGMV